MMGMNGVKISGPNSEGDFCLAEESPEAQGIPNSQFPQFDLRYDGRQYPNFFTEEFDLELVSHTSIANGVIEVTQYPSSSSPLMKAQFCHIGAKETPVAIIAGEKSKDKFLVNFYYEQNSIMAQVLLKIRHGRIEIATKSIDYVMMFIADKDSILEHLSSEKITITEDLEELMKQGEVVNVLDWLAGKIGEVVHEVVVREQSAAIIRRLIDSQGQIIERSDSEMPLPELIVTQV